VVQQVPVEAAARAAAFTQFLEGHAHRVYALAGLAQTSAARALARHIASGHLPDPFTGREVARKNWQGLDSQQRIEAALGVLEEFGHIVGIEAPATEKGGRPTVRYRINPAISGAIR
jgi:putative DNA primase/helicase